MVKIVKRRKPATAAALSHATRRLILNTPDYILSSWPIDERGLNDGLELIGLHWQRQIAIGGLRQPDLAAAIVPVAGLAAAMLQSLLRGTAIGQRGEVFAE